MNAKRWVSVLLCALLALGQLGAALADEAARITVSDALAAGREVAYEGSAGWHEFATLDGQTNQILSSLLGAITVQGRMAGDDTQGYGECSLMISGQEALKFQYVTDAEAVYISSAMLGGPIALRYDEMDMLMERVQAYAGEFGDEIVITDSMNAFTSGWTLGVEAGQQMLADLGLDVELKEDMTQEEALELMRELYAQMGLEGLIDKALAWNEEHPVIERAEDIGSFYGVASDSAEVYLLDRDGMIELFDIVIDEMDGNEVFWRKMLDIMRSMDDGTLGLEEVSDEEILAELPETLAQMREAFAEIPEETYFAYNMLYDGGAYVMGQLEAYVPGDEYGYGETFAYAEWLTQALMVYAEVGADQEGFRFELEGKEEGNDGFLALLTYLSYGEPEFYIGMDVDSYVSYPAENERLAEQDIYVGLSDSYEEFGLRIFAEQHEAYEGADVGQSNGMDVMFYDGTDTLPLISLVTYVSTGEPAGEPFDVAATEFVYPARMTDEAFSAWIDQLMLSAAQAAFGIIALLPQDVLAVIMPQSEPAAAPEAEALPEAVTENETVAEPTTEDAPIADAPAEEAAAPSGGN